MRPKPDLNLKPDLHSKTVIQPKSAAQPKPVQSKSVAQPKPVQSKPAIQPDPDQLTARRRLGTELRGLRGRAYRTGQDVASALGWSQSKVSRIEQARTMPTVHDVRTLLHELGVPAHQQAQLLRLAEAAAGAHATRRNTSRAGLTRRQQDFVALERAATSIRCYQPLLIPGYLQTEEYARRVLDMTDSTSIDRAVELRTARQATLCAPDAPTYQLVLMETALHWRPGDRALMVEQLTLMVKLAELSNVDLRILPLGYPQTTYLQHPCTIFEFDRPSENEALIETLVQDLRITDVLGVGRLRRQFERLASAAMAPHQSLSYIRTIASSYVDGRD
jgi:transcriptional regulator with XRE-family HTH domain